MRISLRIDAETPAEFQAALDVLHAQMARNLAKDLVAQETQPPKPEPKPIPPQPEPKLEKEPEPDQPEPAQETPEQPVEAPKARRGRPRKSEPVEAPPATTPEPVVAIERPAHKVESASVVVRQDLLDTFNEYVQKYGINFGYTDVSKILQQHFGGEVKKASDVTDANLANAIAAVQAAINDNPFNRKRVVDAAA